MTEQNPLKAHFRQPSIYIKLPSNGKWYPEGTLEESETGEYSVLPMTAKDELTLKTPDALMNGQATATLIESCIPNIKNGWAVPSVDIDSILIAIRIASYSETMDIKTKCPHCEDHPEYDFGVDLRTLIDQLSDVNWDENVEFVDNFEIKVKPLSYTELSKNQIKAWEQQKIYSVVSDSTLTDVQKNEHFAQSFATLAEINLDLLTASVASIKTAEGVVVENKDHIREFINNADRKVFSTLHDHVEKQKKSQTIKPLVATCTVCEKTWTVPLTFDQSNFFG